MEAKDIINYINNMAARLKEAAPDSQWLTVSPVCCNNLSPEVMLEVCENYTFKQLRRGYKCIEATIKVDQVAIHISTASIDIQEPPAVDMLAMLREVVTTTKTAA